MLKKVINKMNSTFVCHFICFVIFVAHSTLALTNITDEMIETSKFYNLKEVIEAEQIETRNHGIRAQSKITRVELIEQIVTFHCIHASNFRRSQATVGDVQIASKINFSRPIGFIIHGWMDSIDFNWMSDVGIEWADNYKSNVCLVDWTISARTKYYDTVNFHIEPVAEYTIKFLEFLEQVGNVSSRDVTITGHSLGAHIAGYIGRNLNGKLKLIVAMDAAGPLFTRPFLKDTLERLDASDAAHVMAIHSSDGLLGVNIQIGHQDFYLNDGRFPQPGCTIERTLAGEENDPIRCSHFRAVDYLRSSIMGKKCVGYKCGSFREYEEGLCKELHDYLGFKAHKMPGTFIVPVSQTKECWW